MLACCKQSVVETTGHFVLWFSFILVLRSLKVILIVIWASAWDFQQCGMCNQQSLRSACSYAQSDQSLCLSPEYSMIVKLLTEHHLEFLSLKWGCRGSSESTIVKMPHCWNFYALAQIIVILPSLAFYCFFSTRLINLIKHEYSCKILYFVSSKL